MLIFHIVAFALVLYKLLLRQCLLRAIERDLSSLCCKLSLTVVKCGPYLLYATTIVSLIRFALIWLYLLLFFSRQHIEK